MVVAQFAHQFLQFLSFFLGLDREGLELLGGGQDFSDVLENGVLVEVAVVGLLVLDEDAVGSSVALLDVPEVD